MPLFCNTIYVVFAGYAGFDRAPGIEFCMLAKFYFSKKIFRKKQVVLLVRAVFNPQVFA